MTLLQGCLALGFTRFACAAVLLLASGCVRADPNHCANLGGDATCTELGIGAFCSSCVGNNRGCVADSPSDRCARPGEVLDPTATTSESTSGVTGSSSEGSSDETAAPLCDGLGRDPACPDGQPYCLDGACATCEQGFECASTDEGSVCVAGWGQCAVCTADDETACDADTFCDDTFACDGCTDHAQCPESACDLETGLCMPTDRVFHVNRGSCVAGAAGTARDPFCTIAEAFEPTNIPDEGQGTILLFGGSGSYDERVNLDASGPRTVAILGRGIPTLSGNPQAADVSTGARLFVDNVIVAGAAEAGLQCSDKGRIWVDRSAVVNNGVGIDATDCRVTVRRSRIFSNDGDGITAADGTSVTILSSAIVGNGEEDTETVSLRSNASTFSIVYSTIVGNASAPGPDNIPPRSSIFCSGGLGGPVRNSVVVAAGLESISCPWAEFENSFVDTTGMGGPAQANVVAEAFDEGWFADLAEDNVSVADPATSPFADVARWQLGDPQRDRDGTMRVAYPDAPGFAGADEP